MSYVAIFYFMTQYIDCKYDKCVILFGYKLEGGIQIDFIFQSRYETFFNKKRN